MFEHDRLSPERLYLLQIGWVNLLASFGVAPDRAYPLHDRLLAAYAEPGRYYHNLEHITEMLRIVGRLGRETPHLALLQLAVWFHDAVYDPKAKDNEEQSAALANRELAELGLEEKPIALVSQWIRATKHLNAPLPDAESAILLDADLAILGSEPVRYRRYAADIRKEYSFVNDGDYRKGRTAVLESFLKRSSIYHTKIMGLEGEEAARRNIQDEIAELTAKLTP